MALLYKDEVELALKAVRHLRDYHAELLRTGRDADPYTIEHAKKERQMCSELIDRLRAIQKGEY